MKQLRDNIYEIPLGGVNAFLIDHGKLTLIDTGYPGNGAKILEAVRSLGKTPQDIENIICTHLHTDHTGNAAELKAATGANLIMSEIDAEPVERGISFRDRIEVSPGLINKIVFRLMVKNVPRTIESVRVDRRIGPEDEKLDIGCGFTVIPVPGHARGQIALLYHEHGGVLFAADACGNVMGMSVAPFYEDYRAGIHDLRKLMEYDFAIATFGHGKAVVGNAAEKFRKRFGRVVKKAERRIASGKLTYSE